MTEQALPKQELLGTCAEFKTPHAENCCCKNWQSGHDQKDDSALGTCDYTGCDPHVRNEECQHWKPLDDSASAQPQPSRVRCIICKRVDNVHGPESASEPSQEGSDAKRQLPPPLDRFQFAEAFASSRESREIDTILEEKEKLLGLLQAAEQRESYLHAEIAKLQGIVTDGDIENQQMEQRESAYRAALERIAHHGEHSGNIPCPSDYVNYVEPMRKIAREALSGSPAAKKEGL